MSKRTLIFKLVGISLTAAFILTSCSVAATPVESASATAPLQASQNTVVPTTTFTLVPSMTDTATLVPTYTPTLTATEPPTPTFELTPQVNPGMNAYCRKGPGTYYYAITFLQAGTNYNLIGQNGLNTWWLVQVGKKVTCWIGDPTSVMTGPVWDVPILTFPPLPRVPTSFTGKITCHSVQNILYVSLVWDAQDDATGFHLFLNGKLLSNLDLRPTNYQDNSPPFGVDLNYELEAYNDYGVSPRVSVSFPFCG